LKPPFGRGKPTACASAARGASAASEAVGWMRWLASALLLQGAFTSYAIVHFAKRTGLRNLIAPDNARPCL